MNPIGIILAGGQASRMGGGDKALKEIGGTTILARVIARLQTQCERLAINANGDPHRFAPFGLPIFADRITGFAGPLAGILAGMEWTAQHHPHATTILSIAADCPFLPVDLVEKLEMARNAEKKTLAAAASGGWTHPVIGLWPLALRHDLEKALLAGERKIDRFTASHGIAHAEWPILPFDPFFNANAPEDLAEAERLATQFPAA